MSEFRERLKRSPLCRRFGLDYPIVQAGMGGVAGGALAAAVSNAGGLGTIGAGFTSADDLAREIALAKRLTSKPFGVNLLFARAGGDDPVGARYRRLFEDQIAVVLASDIPILVSGLGNPADYIAIAHERGMTVMSVVGTVAQARKLAAVGVDLVIAQGVDGGGHVGRVGTMVLVPAAIDAVNVPVLAAGGIADGRGLAAVLALGAAGAWIGTRFIASVESTVPTSYRERVIAADDDGTVVTRANTGKTSRLLKNRFTADWAAREAEIEAYPYQFEKVGVAATALGLSGEDPDNAALPAGQSAALVRRVMPAAEIVAELVAEAEAAFAGGLLGSASR
ncbi:MAG: nitronate monooxygenase [Rhodospirillaceae bacterium]|nr:nitronate monooxygenase [Rhodospirillaceae bacterium]